MLASLALILAGCSKSSMPAPTATAPATHPASLTATASAAPTAPAPTPTPVALPGSAFPADQAQNLRDLIARTVELRGLSPKGDFEKRLIGRQAAGDYLEKSFDPTDRQLLALKQEVYRLLGLVPDDADLLQLQISLLRGLVLGFYDPDVKALFILQDLGLNSVVTRTTIVHEVVHALQDQHYDLNAVDLQIRDDWDRSIAYTDLVEGDARGIETVFISPTAANNAAVNCNDSSFAVNLNSSIPVVIQRELQAPYSDGRCLIATVQGRLPEGVDSIFKAPPRSTEQVLHPEKYLAGEEPESVRLQPLQSALGPGWRQTATSTFGEFTLQNLLLLGVRDTATVKRGADGWGGDRWALYARDDGARLIHLATTWDSEAEAREFWDIFGRSINARSRGTVFAGGVPAIGYVEGNKTMRASISGRVVTIVMSSDGPAAHTAAAALGLNPLGP